MTAGQAVEPRSQARRGTPRVPAIRVDRLTKSYGAVKAVDELSFEVGWGKVTGFLGPNGAGKTTTLRAILGLVHPTSGSVAVLGRPYAQLEQPARRVGAVLETTTFDPRRSARENLRILATAAGIDRARVDRVLKLAGIQDAAGRKVGALSLGMRQRLGLAAAVLGSPRVLILDEPFNGLDPAGIRWLRRSLQRYAERGNAVLVSSHILPEMAQMADDLVVIDRGRLVAKTTVTELTSGTTDLERAFFRLLSDKEES